MRDELLNETLFFNLDQVRKVIAAWVEDYNTARPHSALAYQTPAAFAAKLTATGLHAALTDGSALRPVAQPAQPGLQLPEALKTAG
jgi:putative transposase